MPASGRARRMGEDKLFADVGGRPLVAHTLAGAAASRAFARLVIAAPADRHEQLRDIAIAAGFTDTVVVEGGERRQDSVRAALRAVGDADVIAVHDAARPLCPPALYATCVAAAERHRAATAAVPVVDSVKRARDGVITESFRRDELVAIQTPQAFHSALLIAGHAAAVESARLVDDDAALVEALGVPVHVVEGSADNLKVTHPRDLVLVRALVAQR